MEIEGQSKSLLFNHYTIDEGLSQNSVDAIIQDSRGFIWIATWDGLNRFDGYKFTKYFKNKEPKKGPISNFIRCLSEDQYGNIWLGTSEGLSVFVYSRNQFLHYTPSENGLSSKEIWSVLVDDFGRLWVGTVETGVDIFEIKAEGELKKIKHLSTATGPINIINNRINNIYNAHDNIWLCTDNGICKIDSTLSVIENILPEQYSFIKFNDLRVYDMVKVGQDFWLATHVGLIKVNFDTKESVTYFQEQDQVFELPHNSIRALKYDNQGNLLIGTLGGYAILNLKSLNLSVYQYNSIKPRSLNNDFVNCLYKDTDGNVWIGTEKGGLNHYNINQNQFEYYVHDPDNPNSINTDLINSILDTKKWLFIGTAGGGLNAYNKATGKFQYIIPENSAYENYKISGKFITSLYMDKTGTLWIGTWGNGLSYITSQNIDRGKIDYINATISNRDSLTGRYISSIKEDKFGNLWIAGYDGLDKITQDKRVFNFDDLGIQRIGCLLFDSYGQLWIGTEIGLHVISSLKNEEITSQNINIHSFLPDSANGSIKGQYIISLHQGEDGSIWIGTYDNGINKAIINPTSALPDSFINYSVEDGLSNKTVYGIVEDEENNLWMSTDKGLSKFNTQKEEFTNYYVNDGLLSNQFYWSAAHKGVDGKVFFGGTKGLQAFYPQTINERSDAPEIQLTTFKVFNKSIEPGNENSPLNKHINHTESVTLKHNQNTISFEFVAINFNNTDLIGYKYLLKGIDSDWIEVKNNLEAQYTKLPPGKYLFSVMAYEKTNPNNKSVKYVLVEIRPAYYQTVWFKLTLIGTLLILLILFYFQRVRQLKTINSYLEKKVNERTKEIKEQNDEIVLQSNEILNKNEEINAQKDLLVDQTKELEKANERLNNIKDQLEEQVLIRTQELRVAKEKAEESDNLKTTFLENLSHEIRTPLNAIIGFSSLVFDDDTTYSERIEYKGVVERSSNMLLDLISDIIEISKLETGDLKLQLKDCLLIELLLELKEIYKYELKKHNKDREKSIELKINIPDAIKDKIIITDPQRLSQILTILLNNAVKFTSKGFIEIGCSFQDDYYIQFYVKDTGVGINKANQDVIFERFRKADSGSDVMFRGAGIGLTIAKKLVDLFGGNIWVESEENKGTTFFFSIQNKASKSEIVANPNILKERKKADIPDLSGKTILIAEDDDANFQYLKKLVQKTKARIMHAQNGKEVLKIINAGNAVDIVLMDIKMPEMNGYEAFEALRAQNFTLPIIAQTAYSFSEDSARIMEMGFNGYISKPIRPKRLFSLLDQSQ